MLVPTASAGADGHDETLVEQAEIALETAGGLPPLHQAAHGQTAGGERYHVVTMVDLPDQVHGVSMVSYKRSVGGHGSGADTRIYCQATPWDPAEFPFAYDGMWALFGPSDSSAGWVEMGFDYLCERSASTGTTQLLRRYEMQAHRFYGDPDFWRRSVSMTGTGTQKVTIARSTDDCRRWVFHVGGTAVRSIIVQSAAGACVVADAAHWGTETNATYPKATKPNEQVVYKDHNHLVDTWYRNPALNWRNPPEEHRRRFRGHAPMADGHWMRSWTDEIHTCLHIGHRCHP